MRLLATSRLAGWALGVSQWAWVALLAVVVALGLWVIFTFNRLIRRRNLLQEGWSGIDVQLARRANLIPSLAETVKGYASHEKAALEEVTALRAQQRGRGHLKERQDHENALTDQLRGLFALAERYPDLKANQNFLDLQGRLAEIEDQIQMARRYYNGAVRDYNIGVQSFPGNIVAGIFKFRSEEYFEIETATQRQAPRVEVS